MSSPHPPRRRIAGEAKPAAPAQPAKPVKKARKPALRKPAKKESVAPPATSPAVPRRPARPARPAVTEPTTGRRTAVEDPAQTADTDGAAGTPGRRFSWVRAALVLLTVVAVAFGVVFGVRGWQDWQDTHGIVAAHDEAARTAAGDAETIFSYRYDKLDAHLDDAKATMTASFAKKFETIAPALNDLAPQRKIQVKASTRDAAAVACGSSCDPDRATVLVFIDQARLADGDKDPTVFANRITMSMVMQDGRWLVDGIQAL